MGAIARKDGERVSRASHTARDREMAMVRLSTLGALDLTAESQTAELRHLLQQPKRIGLLVYLRLHASRGPVRRDTLLGMFWPDLPQDRARRALSQALYVLRQSLGNGLVDTTGQETVSVDASGIWCDVAQFEEALTRGIREDALALYHGDFLDGFFLSDAPEFEHWLDSERMRLNGLAADAARTLADQEAATGNLVGAAQWARRRAQLTPYDERAIVGLIEILIRGGDRSGARHEYQLYRDRLCADLELEPSAEVEGALSEGETRPPPMHGSVVAPPQERATDHVSDAEPPKSDTDSPTSRRPRVRALVFAALLATVLVAYLLPTTVFTKESNRALGGDARPRLLVTELANQTGDATMAPLARLASDWLSSEIARTGRVRVVPPLFVQQTLHEVEDWGDTSMLTRLLTAGRQTDATIVLGGYLVGSTDSARLEVFGLDPATGEFVFVLDPIPVTTTAPQEGFERLREATAIALSVRFDDRLVEWMARASQPPSLESYRRYSEALDLFLAGTWAQQEEATELFIEAWRADTAFTAPLILALLGMMNTDQGDRADSVAHALEPNASSLAEWDNAMLRYVLGWLHGDLRAQYRWAREIVALAPNSEWRILLARAAANVGCRDEALSVLEGMDSRSGFLHRSEFGYWSLRLDLRHLTGDTVGENRDALLAQAQLSDELHPRQGHRALVAQIRVAARVGDVPRLEQHLGETRSLGRAAHSVYLMLLYWGPLDLAPDRPEYQTILDSAFAWYRDRPEENRNRCGYKNAWFNLLYHSGRWQEAAQELESLTASGCLVYPAYGMYRAALAAHLGDVDRARAITDSFPWTNHMGTVQLGSQSFWKARVEAIAGEPAKAVTYLRAANRKGIPYAALHENTARIDFATMWDYGPLRQLLANHQCSDGE